MKTPSRPPTRPERTPRSVSAIALGQEESRNNQTTPKSYRARPSITTTNNSSAALAAEAFACSPSRRQPRWLRLRPTVNSEGGKPGGKRETSRGAGRRGSAATRLRAMDPINYIPHGSQRLPSHSDPLHGHAGPWMADAHDMANSPWPPHSSVSPLYFSQTQPPPSHSNPEPLPFGLQGALPHPDRSIRGQQQSQQQDSVAGQPPPQSNHWGSALHSVSGLASTASISQGEAGGLISHPGEREMPAGAPLGHGGRGFASQPQGAVNMGPPGATSETHSLPAGGSLFSSPDRLANPYGQPSASHLSTPHHHPFNLTPPRRAAQSTSSAAPSPITPRAHQQSHGSGKPALSSLSFLSLLSLLSPLPCPTLPSPMMHAVSSRPLL